MVRHTRDKREKGRSYVYSTHTPAAQPQSSHPHLAYQTTASREKVYMPCIDLCALNDEGILGTGQRACMSPCKRPSHPSHTHSGRQMERERERERETGTQTGEQAGRQAGRQTEKRETQILIRSSKEGRHRPGRQVAGGGHRSLVVRLPTYIHTRNEHYLNVE